MPSRADLFLETLTPWAEAEGGIRFAMIVGSQARRADPADEFSDIDVVLSCADPRPYLDASDWLAPLGTPLLSFVEPTAVGGEFERRVLFDSGLDVDFVLLPHATLAGWAADGMPPEFGTVAARGLRILVDKDGIGARLVDRLPPKAPPDRIWSAAEFAGKTQDFLYHCLWAARKAARGELFVALQCLNGLLRPHLFDLARMHLRLTRGEATDWYGARMIERWADPVTIAALARTCAGHDRAGILSALDAAIDLHASLGREVCDRLAISYPAEAAAQIREMVARV
ncbi:MULTISPECIES: aminoglycoside 6-adenylyltransferase [unclassified Inquilinus]|uniref:aminoglycoside 6-adenylyltransferase n=1 Tax=unclassified Inquilinus TaxID=2645927 RepID=UPI003F906A01